MYQEDLLVEGTATHYSILARKIPRTEGPGRLQSMGLQRVRHNWNNWAQTQHTHTHTASLFFLELVVNYERKIKLCTKYRNDQDATYLGLLPLPSLQGDAGIFNVQGTGAGGQNVAGLIQTGEGSERIADVPNTSSPGEGTWELLLKGINLQLVDK